MLYSSAISPDGKLLAVAGYPVSSENENYIIIIDIEIVAIIAKIKIITAEIVAEIVAARIIIAKQFISVEIEIIIVGHAHPLHVVRDE